MESLFGQLKAALNKPAETSSGALKEDKSRGWDQLDVLSMEDEQETKRQQRFEKIEKSLRKLPKLNDEFDKMATETKNAARHTTVKNTDVENTGAKRAQAAEDWFTLPKPDGEMLAKAQRDLVLIKHRSALDPKRHYKKDRWKVPERFAIGTIVENKTEFFSSRMTNKERKSTILESLMSDKDTTGYFKRKYAEIQVKKTSGKKAHYKKMKSMRHR